MVDRNCLENSRRCKLTVGSNPTLSSIIRRSIQQMGPLLAPSLLLFVFLIHLIVRQSF